jgi:hypothetical protein
LFFSFNQIFAFCLIQAHRRVQEIGKRNRQLEKNQVSTRKRNSIQQIFCSFIFTDLLKRKIGKRLAKHRKLQQISSSKRFAQRGEPEFE